MLTLHDDNLGKGPRLRGRLVRTVLTYRYAQRLTLWSTLAFFTSRRTILEPGYVNVMFCVLSLTALFSTLPPSCVSTPCACPTATAVRRASPSQWGNGWWPHGWKPRGSCNSRLAKSWTLKMRYLSLRRPRTVYGTLFSLVGLWFNLQYVSVIINVLKHNSKTYYIVWA